MTRREIKPPHTGEPMVCPYCGADLVFGTVTSAIICTCPNCGKSFLIKNDAPKKPAESVKKS